MPFTFTRLRIPEVVLVESRAYPDERGLFLETYRRSAFVDGGIGEHFVQDNCSQSIGRVLRGLHYQKNPAAQGKLVMVARGEIFDVAVDIRRGSPTYGQWEGVMLSSANHLMLYVPGGFAHGFCVLGEEAVVCYKVTSEYSPEHDRGIVWNDPQVGIAWPITNPILSPRDAQLPLLSEADNNFSYGGDV